MNPNIPNHTLIRVIASDGDYTLRQCKYDMLLMWNWLSLNTGKSIIGFLKYHINYPILLSHCGACEYNDRTRINCEGCPIWSVKGGGSHPSCMLVGSPYLEWRIAFKARNKEDCKKYALEMVKLIERIEV